MSDKIPRCGDTVLHLPSGQKWEVAYADKATNQLAWSGWPEGYARISDCELINACSDEEHRKAVVQWIGTGLVSKASVGHDHRRHRIAQLYGPALGLDVHLSGFPVEVKINLADLEQMRAELVEVEAAREFRKAVEDALGFGGGNVVTDEELIQAIKQKTGAAVEALVDKFFDAMGLPHGFRPAFPTLKLAFPTALINRFNVISEEFNEFRAAAFGVTESVVVEAVQPILRVEQVADMFAEAADLYLSVLALPRHFGVSWSQWNKLVEAVAEANARKGKDGRKPEDWEPADVAAIVGEWFT